MNKNSIKYQSGLGRKEAKKALEEFLASENDARVFAVKGDWGVGKTHLVKTFLRQISQSYHYSSIFGISKIEDLKMQLWSNFNLDNKADSKKKGWNLSNILPKLDKNSKDLGNIVEAIPQMGEYGTGFTPAMITLASNFIINNTLQDKLICIDDIERRSKSLSLNEILGFVENLVEDKNCKVIIIYNEDKLKEDEESIGILKEYKEKVIDFEIKFDPSPGDNFRISFGENDPDEDIIFDYFTRIDFKVNNIRILKRIKLTLDKIRPSINRFLPGVRKKIIDEVIFMTLAKLDTRVSVNLDNLLSLGSFQNILSKGEDEERNLYLHAHTLGYTESRISIEIFRLIESSICNYKVIKNKGEELNKVEKSHRVFEKFNEALKIYSESFELSKFDLQRDLINFLEQHCEFLDYRNFQLIKDISCTVDLVIDPYYKKWLQYQINQVQTLEDCINLQPFLETNILNGESKLKAELDHKISIFEEEMSIDSVLIRILDRKYSSQQDILFLNSRDIDQWKQWLLVKHPKKVSMIRQGLKMMDESPQTLKMAIIELAKNDDLNRIRAEKLYGVILEGSGD